MGSRPWLQGRPSQESAPHPKTKSCATAPIHITLGTYVCIILYLCMDFMFYFIFMYLRIFLTTEMAFPGVTIPSLKIETLMRGRVVCQGLFGYHRSGSHIG